MMPESRTTLLLDSAVAHEAGIRTPQAVIVASAGRRGVDLEAIVGAVSDAASPVLALLRPPWALAGSALVAAVVMLNDGHVVWLPPDVVPAAWAAVLVATWAGDLPVPHLLRRAQVAVGLAALPACRVPRRPWGTEGVPMPALGGTALARWCDRAWRPCDQCDDGGGPPGGACARCGHEAWA